MPGRQMAAIHKDVSLHDIVVLWATPRSTTTAFEWMMRMRGDMACSAPATAERRR